MRVALIGSRSQRSHGERTDIDVYLIQQKSIVHFIEEEIFAAGHKKDTCNFERYFIFCESKFAKAGTKSNLWIA